MHKPDDEKMVLGLKETLIVLGISIIVTPIVYWFIMLEPFWFIR